MVFKKGDLVEVYGHVPFELGMGMDMGLKGCWYSYGYTGTVVSVISESEIVVSIKSRDCGDIEAEVHPLQCVKKRKPRRKKTK